MSYRYAVLGAGRQGIAAAYDLARFGDAAGITLFDSNSLSARQGAERINSLLSTRCVHANTLNVTDRKALSKALAEIHATVSAVPFQYNPGITEAAIEAGSSLVDMGGNTEIVRKQLAMGDRAEAQGVSIIPDCGMAPGLNINMGVRAMELVEEPEELHIWDGGLPLNPQPPYNYTLLFHINGLTNEYDGHAHFLRNGQVTEVPCLTELELIEFEPLGTLEAAVTAGGLSTMPWTFEGKLRRLENRTLRYLGHWEHFRTFQELGLFSEEPVSVNARRISPRDLYHKLLEKKIHTENVQDICLIRVQCTGTSNNKMASCTLDLVETADLDTGFTAMEKLTGWHASLIAILAAKGALPRGAVPVDSALSGETFDREIEKRGWELRKTVTP
ncbi:MULTISPECIES: saccharopine dehydrogenase family protein [unclassified Nitrospina]|uniref:saccharopine dehydrogenase family protein n=1 Tax=unclassified Nitrospina TaxID=2638683 RepID=UPI003F9727C6